MSETPPGIDTVRLLLEAARYLGETLEPQRVYERFREMVAEPIPHDGLTVASFDPEDGLIRCDYAWIDGVAIDPETLPPVPFQPDGGGMQSQVIKTGEPFLTNEVSERINAGGTYYEADSEGNVRPLGPDEEPPAAKAIMMLPIKHEGVVVGNVQLTSDHTHYSQEQFELAEGMVAQLGASVRNARLHQAVRAEAAARLQAEAERTELEAREAAARAVAAEREDAARVLEALGEGIAVVGVDGRVQVWNRAAEIVTGIRRLDALGRRIDDLFGGWSDVGESVPVAEPGRRPRSTAVPVLVLGRELWLSVVAVESAAGTVYAFRDLTAERHLDEAKTDFIATISHELRTPMTAVLGAATTLLRDDLPFTEAQRRELLEMIATQATRLGSVTEEVLLASSLDRDEVQIETESVDVEEVIVETVDALAPSVPDSISLELALGRPGPVLGDRDRLQQVLVNLIDNAVKYSPDGGLVLVSTARTRSSVRVAVADEGIGIAPAEQARVFDKFYRVDSSLTRGPGGTGLGLYICRGLVERMGGRLGLRSEAGRGSTFLVDLPAA
ncbi:MAG TPA: ATP-binding protein [Gaiellaceae bacterium]|nr:ATP-binding protein [Gaiellaceae bacterium]